MPHPHVIRSVLAGALILFFGAHVFGQEGQISDRPPNIVFIIADDLGYHEVGAFGQEKIRTPHLDRLASEGVRLTRHYSGSAVCAPTRSVLMTGLHSGHATIRGNKPVPGGNWDPESPEGQWPIPEADYTIAEMLKARGYATGGFGKWGLGGPGSTGHPNHQGFDHFYGYLCQRVAHNYYPTHLWRNHDVDVLDGNGYFKSHQRIAEPLASEEEYDERYRGALYAPTEIAREMLSWLRGHHESDPDRPFFLYYPTVIPHLALQAPEPFVDSYPRDWDEAHYLGNRGYLPTARPRAMYAAMISYMDHNIGLLLDLLDELGVADDTIVVFTSDNGATYVGGVDRAFFGSLGDLRGHKGNLWEGGIRVPTIVRWPGRVEPGTELALPSYHPDWLPTLAEAAGIAETVGPEDGISDGQEFKGRMAGAQPGDLVWAEGFAPPIAIDGVSILPALTGSAVQAGRGFMYWEFPEGPQQQAVIFGEGGRWKAIRPALRNDPERLEIYDLLADPGERFDLADERPRERAFARRIMATERVASALFPIPALDH